MGDHKRSGIVDVLTGEDGGFEGEDVGSKGTLGVEDAACCAKRICAGKRVLRRRMSVAVRLSMMKRKLCFLFHCTA
jgi:hypothetical protein